MIGQSDKHKNFMRVYFYTLSLLIYMSGCKSDNLNQKVNLELLQDGSISIGSVYWKYESHKYGQIGNPTESKDFIGSISTERFFTNPSSLKISRQRITETDRSAYWYQDIINPSIPKGSSLVLRAKIRTEKIEGGTVAMYILGLFDNKKKENFFISTEGSQKIEGTSDFKEYILRFDNYVDKYSPTEILQVGLIISGSTTGDVYFDDVSLLIE